MRPTFPLSLTLMLAACATNPVDQVFAVKNRAAYDFSCASAQIQVTPLQAGTYGATGCGQKQVYETRGSMVYREGAAPNPVYVRHPTYYGGLGYYY